LQGQIELAEPHIRERQDLFEALSAVQLNTGDALAQAIAQINLGTGAAAGLVPDGASKEEATRVLTEALIVRDDLIIRILPEWAEIANKAFLKSQGRLVDPKARDIKPTRPPAATGAGAAQKPSRSSTEQPAPTGKFTQEQIRQKAAEFNQAQQGQ
jgi:hypothetical protein